MSSEAPAVPVIEDLGLADFAIVSALNELILSAAGRRDVIAAILAVVVNRPLDDDTVATDIRRLNALEALEAWRRIE